MSTCRVSVLDDLPRIAECHMKAFPHSLSTLQGADFVIKMLEWYIVSKRGVIFHIEQDERVVGYCGGIVIKSPGLPGAVTSISQYSFWAFVFAYVKKPWLVFHLENLKRWRYIIRNLLIRIGMRRTEGKVSPEQQKAFKSSWGLVVIGVIPLAQGKGNGRELLLEFERQARADGVDRVQLSVKASNEKALKSYIRNGWNEVCRDRESMSMCKNLGS